jgi:hypothetical protein
MPMSGSDFQGVLPMENYLRDEPEFAAFAGGVE